LTYQNLVTNKIKILICGTHDQNYAQLIKFLLIHKSASKNILVFQKQIGLEQQKKPYHGQIA